MTAAATGVRSLSERRVSLSTSDLLGPCRISVHDLQPSSVDHWRLLDGSLEKLRRSRSPLAKQPGTPPKKCLSAIDRLTLENAEDRACNSAMDRLAQLRVGTPPPRPMDSSACWSSSRRQSVPDFGALPQQALTPTRRMSLADYGAASTPRFRQTAQDTAENPRATASVPAQVRGCPQAEAPSQRLGTPPPLARNSIVLPKVPPLPQPLRSIIGAEPPATHIKLLDSLEAVIHEDTCTASSSSTTSIDEVVPIGTRWEVLEQSLRQLQSRSRSPGFGGAPPKMPAQSSPPLPGRPQVKAAVETRSVPSRGSLSGPVPPVDKALASSGADRPSAANVASSVELLPKFGQSKPVATDAPEGACPEDIQSSHRQPKDPQEVLSRELQLAKQQLHEIQDGLRSALRGSKNWRAECFVVEADGLVPPAALASVFSFLQRLVRESNASTSDEVLRLQLEVADQRKTISKLQRENDELKAVEMKHAAGDVSLEQTKELARSQEDMSKSARGGDHLNVRTASHERGVVNPVKASLGSTTDFGTSLQSDASVAASSSGKSADDGLWDDLARLQNKLSKQQQQIGEVAVIDHGKDRQTADLCSCDIAQSDKIPSSSDDLEVLHSRLLRQPKEPAGVEGDNRPKVDLTSICSTVSAEEIGANVRNDVSILQDKMAMPDATDSNINRPKADPISICDSAASTRPSSSGNLSDGDDRAKCESGTGRSCQDALHPGSTRSMASSLSPRTEETKDAELAPDAPPSGSSTPTGGSSNTALQKLLQMIDGPGVHDASRLSSLEAALRPRSPTPTPGLPPASDLRFPSSAPGGGLTFMDAKLGYAAPAWRPSPSPLRRSGASFEWLADPGRSPPASIGLRSGRSPKGKESGDVSQAVG